MTFWLKIQLYHWKYAVSETRIKKSILVLFDEHYVINWSISSFNVVKLCEGLKLGNSCEG